MRKRLDGCDLDDDDMHVGCFSYPNCDEDPNGCLLEMGSEAEQYGHRGEFKAPTINEFLMLHGEDELRKAFDNAPRNTLEATNVDTFRDDA